MDNKHILDEEEDDLMADIENVLEEMLQGKMKCGTPRFNARRKERLEQTEKEQTEQ